MLFHKHHVGIKLGYVPNNVGNKLKSLNSCKMSMLNNTANIKLGIIFLLN